MGNTWTKELPSSWHKDDVIAWMERAMAQQKSYYNGYAGTQWHSFGYNDRDLLKAKICFALYGLPKVNEEGLEMEEEEEDLLALYTGEQQREATKIVDNIAKLYKDPKAAITMMVIFIVCKMNEAEFPLPIIRVDLGGNLGAKGGGQRYMEPTTGRIYDTWIDWRNNNKLPMMKYCYPEHGFYSSSYDKERVEYEEDQYPALGFGTSPVCDVDSRVARTVDVTTGITTLASGGIAIASLFTPLAPIVLTGAAITGGVSALWGTSRSVQRLYDKGKHGESLTDLESMTSWVAIALTPVAFATSAVNATLATGARASGRIFSDTARTAATLLNCTNLGLQSGMMLLGLANLIEKKKNDQLSALDVLQFSMTVFFFTNTLIQPKTASGIISKAQNEHIEMYKNSMTDAAAKKTFEQFLEQNQAEGGIVAKSKIVRTINRIEQPDSVFSGLSQTESILIGGRKGKTLLVSKGGEAPVRISPNKMAVSAGPSGSLTAVPVTAATLKRDYSNRLVAVRLFAKIDDPQKEKLDMALKGVDATYSDKIIDIAMNLADKLELNSIEGFCGLLVTVGEAVRGLSQDEVDEIVADSSSRDTPPPYARFSLPQESDDEHSLIDGTSTEAEPSPRTPSILQVVPRLSSLSDLQTLSQFSRLNWSYMKESAVGIFLCQLAETPTSPIFEEGERGSAEEAVERCLPVLRQAFASFSTRFEAVHRAEAQFWRSGLQYLVEDFRSNGELFALLEEELLRSEAVTDIEDRIEITKEAAISSARGRTLPSSVPPHHTWMS